HHARGSPARDQRGSLDVTRTILSADGLEAHHAIARLYIPRALREENAHGSARSIVPAQTRDARKPRRIEIIRNRRPRRRRPSPSRAAAGAAGIEEPRPNRCRDWDSAGSRDARGIRSLARRSAPARTGEIRLVGPTRPEPSPARALSGNCR